MKNDLIAWLKFLKSVGYDGWRFDFVRGYSGEFARTYIDATVRAWGAQGRLGPGAWDNGCWRASNGYSGEIARNCIDATACGLLGPVRDARGVAQPAGAKRTHRALANLSVGEVPTCHPWRPTPLRPARTPQVPQLAFGEFWDSCEYSDGVLNYNQVRGSQPWRLLGSFA